MAIDNLTIQIDAETTAAQAAFDRTTEKLLALAAAAKEARRAIEDLGLQTVGGGGSLVEKINHELLQGKRLIIR